MGDAAVPTWEPETREPTKDARDVLADRMAKWLGDDAGVYRFADDLWRDLNDAGYDIVPEVVVERLNAANARLSAALDATEPTETWERVGWRNTVTGRILGGASLMPPFHGDPSMWEPVFVRRPVPSATPNSTVRELEDAVLALWIEADHKMLREEAPRLADFCAHLHNRVEHEQAMVRRNVWAEATPAAEPTECAYCGGTGWWGLVMPPSREAMECPHPDLGHGGATADKENNEGGDARCGQ